MEPFGLEGKKSRGGTIGAMSQSHVYDRHQVNWIIFSEDQP